MKAFEKNMKLIPINVTGSSHWSLCAIINPSLVTANHFGETDTCPCMAFFDSLVGSGLRNHHAVATDLFQWLNGLWNNTYSCVGNMFSGLTMPVVFPDLPHQINGYDCSTYMCHYASHLFITDFHCELLFLVNKLVDLYSKIPSPVLEYTDNTKGGMAEQDTAV
jgi:Ulp1 family protease